MLGLGRATAGDEPLPGPDVDAADAEAPESRDSVRRSSSSFFKSSAVWMRRAGSFSRQRRTIRLSSRGASMRMSEMGVGVSRMIAVSTDICVSPENGRRPVAISYSTMPSEKMSLR